MLNLQQTKPKVETQRARKLTSVEKLKWLLPCAAATLWLSISTSATATCVMCGWTSCYFYSPGFQTCQVLGNNGTQCSGSCWGGTGNCPPENPYCDEGGPLSGPLKGPRASLQKVLLQKAVPSITTYDAQKCNSELFIPASLPGEVPGPSYASEFATLAAIPTFESLRNGDGKKSSSGMFTFGMPENSEQAAAFLQGATLMLSRESAGLGGLAQYRVVSDSDEEMTVDFSVWVIDRAFDRVLASQRSMVSIAKRSGRFVATVGPVNGPAARIDARKIKQ